VPLSILKAATESEVDAAEQAGLSTLNEEADSQAADCIDLLRKFCPSNIAAPYDLGGKQAEFRMSLMLHAATAQAARGATPIYTLIETACYTGGGKVRESEMRVLLVVVLCAISGVAGVTIDHVYWNQLDTVLGRLMSSQASETQSPTPSLNTKTEVLGDRTKCAFRFQELKLPTEQWEAFIDECMGSAHSKQD
jgi:hypothetical protein